MDMSSIVIMKNSHITLVNEDGSKLVDVTLMQLIQFICTGSIVIIFILV